MLLLSQVIVISGNSMIIRAIVENKSLQTPTNLFLASLAVADLLITVTVPLFQVKDVQVLYNRCG